MKCVEAVVVENRRYSDKCHLLTVRAPEVVAACKPGQFVMASVSEPVEVPAPLLKRALAVFSVLPENGAPLLGTLLIKIVGEGTRKIAEAQPGQSLDLIGPLGNGFDLARGENKINLLVVGGTGVASVYLLAAELSKRGEEVELLFGGRTAADLIGVEEFRRLDIPVTVTTEDGSEGIKGLVTGALRERMIALPSEHLNIYTCGPNAMMEAVTAVALEQSIPCEISVEVKMGCGFGVCLGCTVMTRAGYRLACTHGPAFDAQEFIWETKLMKGVNDS